MLRPQSFVVLKVSGIVGVALGVIGCAIVIVALTQGVGGAPALGLALGSVGCVLGGFSNLVISGTRSKAAGTPGGGAKSTADGQ